MVPTVAHAVPERVEMLPDGETLFDHCNQFAFEGVVSKRRASGYSSGPSRNWVKTKCPEAGSAAVLSAGGFSTSPSRRGDEFLSRLSNSTEVPRERLTLKSGFEPIAVFAPRWQSLSFLHRWRKCTSGWRASPFGVGMATYPFWMFGKEGPMAGHWAARDSWGGRVDADTGVWKWRVKSNYPIVSGTTPKRAAFCSSEIRRSF